ncbi:nucleoside-diphosphate-sugar epimerase [Variovorax paradoxus]|uniref:NAD-dependent epimerase/dehydratase family protein n=1 Tax=Variovorax paradoxus TaxID=34073 RepID=UPI003393DEC8
MIYLVGGRGRVGQAITASRPASEVTLLERDRYQDWWRPGSAKDVAQFFKGAPAGSVVVVAAGLLDPALPHQLLRRVNVDLPLQVLEGATDAGLRVITLGTVMEQLTSHPNVYVASKSELGLQVARRAGAGDPVLHLQIHTLYGGGPPAPFMFLGQMCHAIHRGIPFEMSPGRQLREYHHVDDDVSALHALIAAGVVGIAPVSHGEPSTLADLASAVFKAVGRMDLLRIGARPEPPDDNYATVLARPAVLAGISFRPAQAGVAEYVKSQLSRSERLPK